MFRAAAPGPFDEPVAKATDENLTSEDWGAIMEVCDKVTTDPNGAKESVQSMIKRLAHRNANVQLYTLELANSLSENCGKPIHRELASRAFTDALLKLANDRNTHQQVKSKILERMKHWSEMFSKDIDLGVMGDAYHRLKATNPGLQPPSAPQKNSLTDVDRQKEEEELQIALKLSLQEEDRKKKTGKQPSGSGGASSSAAAGPSGSGGSDPSAAAAAAPLQPMSSGTTAATVSRVRALYDFVPSEPGELEFKKGDVIAVLESVYKDWWRGSLKGKTGIFPLNYVEKLTDPTPDELAREAQMEAEVFAEIKNVEKLLTLLSTSSTSAREEDNEEISKLYHQTLAIRPKLIKLIEKYSQKKDDFTQLNEKFIKARRDYEALLESSMAHRPQPNYHQYAPRPQMNPPYGGAPSGYPQQMPPQQDPQRFYTPGPQQDQNQYPPSSPSPNFQRQPGGVPAPFYMAGAEVPPAGAQGYPPRGGSVAPLPSATPVGGRQQQPAPINTSPPSAGNALYMAYGQAPQQPPPQAGGPRPQSTYGNPQELATSVYDSPVAPSNHPQSAATYSSSVYSQEDPYGASPLAAGGPPGGATQSMYTQLPPPSGAPSAPPPGPPSDLYDGYDAGAPPPAPLGSAPPPPSQPSGAPPPIPGSAAAAATGRPQQVLTPPPLQPSGAAYDARNTLPSQQRVYNAYMPPGQQPSAPSDGMGMGAGQPSAPPAAGAEGYYRTQGQTLY